MYYNIQQELHPKDFSPEAMPVRATPQSAFQNIQGTNLIIIFLFPSPFQTCRTIESLQIYRPGT